MRTEVAGVSSFTRRWVRRAIPFLADTEEDLPRALSLFLISCLMLFFEILMIRWLSAEIRIFSYFHNLVLLFAFLGIGIGMAVAHRRAYLPIPFVMVALLAAGLRFDEYIGLSRVSTFLSALSDYPIWAPFSIHFVEDYERVLVFESEEAKVRAFLVGSYVMIVLMALVTLCFIPLGQITGKLINEYGRPLRAYGINLAGSLAGIWVFNGVSALSLPPGAWLGLAGVGSLVLLRRNRVQMVAVVLFTALSVGLLYEAPTSDRWSLWSPYQKLTVLRFAEKEAEDGSYAYRLLVNSVGFMEIMNYSEGFISRLRTPFPAGEVPYQHYNIPYRFAKNVDDVLIVGAGAGNDAAGALRNGARRVTAVDIDPKVIETGRALHPETPYSNNQVAVVVDDARSFLKRTQEKYDLIIFGLLDSHTLSSSYSNVRLDNYVYTVESFEEARRLLKPQGLVVVVFLVAPQDQFIGERIHAMLSEAFGQQPVGFISPQGRRSGGGTGFVAGDPKIIAERLAGDSRLRDIVDRSHATYQAWATSDVSTATDDWPYLYLEQRGVPPLYYLVFGALLLFSFFGVRAAYRQDYRMNWTFFFLGAGFMLLEVQNISKLALLFGTTWTVNVIVISAVLVTILLANMYAARVRVGSLTPYYVALFGSLLANYLLPIGVFSALPSGPKELLVGVVMGLPFFFAGIIFSTTFSHAENRASALASNLLGAMAGGVLEALAFLFGVKALLIVACVLYGLAWSIGRVSSRRLSALLRA